MKILARIEEITDPRMIGKVQHSFSAIILLHYAVYYQDVKIGMIYMTTVE